jgi:Uma2 family endonuclease
MSRVQQAPATLEDLYREPGKAELIGGRIVRFMATGRKPARIGGRIYRSLDDHAEQTGRGEAYPDNVGFAIPMLPSRRQSFSPDASYYLGPFPENPMHFLDGPPTLAVEVRSDSDYGDTAEEALAEKRNDYFAAGTLVVWDVDPVEECIHVYRLKDPDRPTTYRRGQMAEAEPAVAGWQVSVDWIFATPASR